MADLTDLLTEALGWRAEFAVRALASVAGGWWLLVNPTSGEIMRAEIAVWSGHMPMFAAVALPEEPTP